MAKSRQSVLKKSDLKITQPKISAFFKKQSHADQESTPLKYTCIRPSSEIVLESPECTRPSFHFGGAHEDDDPDIIPDTPQQHRTVSRLFTHTNSRAPCSSPECEVIPPTPLRSGRENKPGVSLAYKLLKSKCDIKPIQRTDLNLLPSNCPQMIKPSFNTKSDQDFQNANLGFGSAILANGLSITPKRGMKETLDTNTRVVKRLKLTQSAFENSLTSCHQSTPTRQTNGMAFVDSLNAVKHLQQNGAEKGDPSSVFPFDDDDFWEDFAELANTTSNHKIDGEQDSAVKHVSNGFHNDLPVQKYNRHKIRQVIRNDPGETVIKVSPIDCNSIIRTCILKGFWADTQACEGDIVNVLGEFDDNGMVVMGGDKGGNLLVVNPDFLVSTTTVVSGVFCRRKAVLNEWFRSVQPRSIHMLVGVLIHQLFQEAAEKRLTAPQEVRSLLADITRRMNNLLEIYGFQGDADFGRLNSELDSFVKPVGDWIRQHIVGNGKPVTHGDNNSKNCKRIMVDVKEIRDIEENVWCPRLGIKGKLDMVVQTSRAGASDSIVPLELKTGRPTFSAEHEGQVTLYRMMSRDRRPKEMDGDGLLLYLRTGECQKVQHKAQAQQQLIQMRNEIASHLGKPMMDAECHTEGLNARRYSLAPLPDPLNSRRVCSGCSLRTVCSLFPSRDDSACHNVELGAVSQSAIEHLMQEKLLQSCTEYFFKWCINVFTEDLCTKNALQLKDVWCEMSQRREERGECFSRMILKPLGENKQENIHRFERCTSHQNGESLAAVGFERMQSVVVSVEKRQLLALGIGHLKDIQEHYVDVVLDRDLYSKGEYASDVFRIDAYRSQAYSVTALSNLARLMSNTAESTKLRNIIIGHEPLKDKLLLTEAMAKKAKPFFEDLNRQQKIAVLMSLATKDYMLIEGTPGSGKTKTVVTIIRMLLHMKHTVLLASHTHSAVDNVLLKLKEKGIENFIRLGKAERVHPKLVDHTSEHLLKGVDCLEKVNSVVNSKQLIATTCLGTNHGIFQHRNKFDYCIIDEATQILQPVCLGPLFFCKRFILVGDPQQLPPIVRSPIAKKEGMDESLFALLKSKEGPKGSQSSVGSRLQLLSEQYRMNAEIMRFSSALSYDNKLECGSGNQPAILSLPKLDKVWQLRCSDLMLTRLTSEHVDASVLLLNTDQLQALEERDSQGKVCSRIEAMITLEIVAFFLECGLNANQVGVISPYRNQVALIKKVLEQKKTEEPQQFAKMSEVEVNTIDQYQGREKDAIIISFVGRSKAGSGQMDQEILCDKRRINVAITRAKTKLLMIGSKEIMRHYKPLDEMLNLMSAEQVIDLTRDCLTAFHWSLKAETSPR